METLSLVPWVERKIVATLSWLKNRSEAIRRVQEYRQMLHWTKSSLQISTAFDWGHTCDIATAINRSAVRALLTTNVLSSRLSFANKTTSRKVSCSSSTSSETGGLESVGDFFFSSRTLLGKAVGEEIPSGLWLQVIECLVLEDVRVHEDDLRLQHQLFSEGTGAGEYSHRSKLICQWVMHCNATIRENWAELVKSPEYIAWKTSTQWFKSEKIKAVLKAWDRIKNDVALKDEMAVAVRVMGWLEAAFQIHYGVAEAERCCREDGAALRKRALLLNMCRGMDMKIKDSRIWNTAEISDLYSWTEAWHELQTKWRFFIDSWDEIVRKASHSFSFPSVRDIDDLVLHDMVTGYVSSSKILRRGGKYTNKNGTTFVHPGERAAVVSSGCTLLSMHDSAVARHGPKRKWGAAADEFARYALSRCDLVKRSRMNFKAAVQDWMSPYVKWDKSPASFSDWAKHDEEEYNFVVDDYRVVLLRQALGTKRSIRIASAVGTEGSLFGHFLPEERRMHLFDPRKYTMRIDQPLSINVSLFDAVETCSEPTEVVCIKDRWGSSDESTVDADGYHLKVVRRSGRPDISTLGVVGSGAESRDVRFPNACGITVPRLFKARGKASEFEVLGYREDKLVSFS